jgi:hypothetical protein
VANPGEAELRGLFGSPPPGAVGGFGLTSPLGPTPLIDITALDQSNPGGEALLSILGGVPSSPQPAAAEPPIVSPGAPSPSLYLIDESGLGMPPAQAAPKAAPQAGTPAPAFDANARRPTSRSWPNGSTAAR